MLNNFVEKIVINNDFYHEPGNSKTGNNIKDNMSLYLVRKVSPVLIDSLMDHEKNIQQKMH